MEDILAELTDHISKNEINLALNKMNSIFSFANSELTNDTILLQAQLAKLKSDARKGILNYEAENFRNNKILNSTIELIDELKNNPDIFDKFSKIDKELDKATENSDFTSRIRRKNALYERLSHIKEKGKSIKAIWIDDNPKNNYKESRILKAIGVNIEIAKSSAKALVLLKNNKYDLILSDVNRDGNENEGYEFHLNLIKNKIDIPLIFYTRFVDRSKGVPPYAFGITHLPNKLLHLVADVIQRN